MWSFDHAKAIIEYLSRGVEFAAALIIGLAAIEAVARALPLFLRRNSPLSAKNDVRLNLGRWLAVGLEFELAADILRTAITPSWRDIEQLAAITPCAPPSIIFWSVRSARNQPRGATRKPDAKHI